HRRAFPAVDGGFERAGFVVELEDVSFAAEADEFIHEDGAFSRARSGGHRAGTGGRFGEYARGGRFEFVDACFAFEVADVDVAGMVDRDPTGEAERLLADIFAAGGKYVDHTCRFIGDIDVTRMPVRGSRRGDRHGGFRGRGATDDPSRRERGPVAFRRWGRT